MLVRLLLGIWMNICVFLCTAVGFPMLLSISCCLLVYITTLSHLLSLYSIEWEDDYVNGDLGRTWKELVLACLSMLSQH